MDENVKKLQSEREANMQNVLDGKIPDRVPINVSLGLDIVCEYADVGRREALWEESLLESAADELCSMIPSDICVYGSKIHKPGHYQTLDSQNCIMAENGFMQHPNTVGMLAEDYDAFIENPFDCIIERILPRNYNGLDYSADPAKAMFPLAKMVMADSYNAGVVGGITSRLIDKYGYYAAKPGTGGGVYTPLDILTDNLRSFSGMLTDMRRRRDKVKAAVEAIYPLNYKIGKPSVLWPYGGPVFPLHMPTYMREKDFAELWWPQWYRQVTDYASLGIHSQAFCEHDWMRYLDYLQDLPVNTKLQFEYGDPKVIKDKLGSRHILTGLFPVSSMRSLTKQQCIDKTKEFIDIMAPGGRFYFMFDKSPLVLADVSTENLTAICETLLDEGKYANPGTPAGLSFSQSDYTHPEAAEFASKYYTTWEQYKAKHPQTPESAKSIVMGYEDRMVAAVYGLCQ